MNVKDELLYDFSIKMPRLLVSGNTGILDNVKKIVYITDSSIIVDHGSRFSAVTGDDLCIKLIEEERVLVTGNIRQVEFYSGKKGDANEK